MNDIRNCSACGKETERMEMLYTKDCHGILMRLVCMECYKKIMHSGRGYDGQYYDERDEEF